MVLQVETHTHTHTHNFNTLVFCDIIVCVCVCVSFWERAEHTSEHWHNWFSSVWCCCCVFWCVWNEQRELIVVCGYDLYWVWWVNVKYAAHVCCVSVGVCWRASVLTFSLFSSLFHERSSRDSSEHYRVRVNAGIHNHTPALSPFAQFNYKDYRTTQTQRLFLKIPYRLFQVCFMNQFYSEDCPCIYR